MEHGDARAVAYGKLPQELRRQGDLRHKNDRTAPGGKAIIDQAEIRDRFAAARHAVEKRRAGRGILQAGRQTVIGCLLLRREQERLRIGRCGRGRRRQDLLLPERQQLQLFQPAERGRRRACVIAQLLTGALTERGKQLHGRRLHGSGRLMRLGKTPRLLGRDGQNGNALRFIVHAAGDGTSRR